MNQAIVEFWDITDGGGFEEWLAGTYAYVPNIGDLVHLTMEDGGEQIWRVKERVVCKGSIRLYCEFFQQYTEPKIK